MAAVAEREPIGVVGGDATACHASITDALNQNTRFTYEAATGNLLTTIDPLTHATAISYNAFGQPISVTDALGNVTQFEYDEVGNLIATIDPLGHRTHRIRGQFLTLHSRRPINSERMQTQELTPDSGALTLSR